jgi:hypothetical protein
MRSLGARFRQILDEGPQALKRDVEEKVADLLREVLEPDENVLASGASYLTTDEDWVEGIDWGEIARKFRSRRSGGGPTQADPSFVVVTNARFLLFRLGSKYPGTKWWGRLTFAEPRSNISVMDVETGSSSVKMTVRRPDRSVVLLDFRKPWLANGAAVRDALADRTVAS